VLISAHAWNTVSFVRCAKGMMFQFFTGKNAIWLPLDITVKSTGWYIIDSAFSINPLCIVHKNWSQKKVF